MSEHGIIIFFKIQCRGLETFNVSYRQISILKIIDKINVDFLSFNILIYDPVTVNQFERTFGKNNTTR